MSAHLDHAAEAVGTLSPWLRALADLDQLARDALINSLTSEEIDYIEHDWERWARPNQVWHPGPEMWTLYSCGRGWGKTRTGAEAVRWVAEHPEEFFRTKDRRKWRVALVARTASDVRDTMLYGPSGLMTISDPGFMPRHTPSSSKRPQLEWPNGVIGFTRSADEPDQLRGPGFAFAWCDELAFWNFGPKKVRKGEQGREAHAWAMVQFCLREAKRWRGIITTTPVPNKVMRELAAESEVQRLLADGDERSDAQLADVVRPRPQPRDVARWRAYFRRVGAARIRVVYGHSEENAANLAEGWYLNLKGQYAGTRLELQELGGQLLTDNPGALWTHDLWARADLDPDDARPGESYEDFVRRVLEIHTVVVAIDPSVSQTAASDETGIIVAGKGPGGRFYVLEDASIDMAKLPADVLGERVWAEAAHRAAVRWGADWIVGEVNNGGNLVASNLRAYQHALEGTRARPIRYQAVRASDNKETRATPVALLYDQGRVIHVGHPRRFRHLEGQCCDFNPADPERDQRCDRMDALVWAITALSEGIEAAGGWSILDGI